MGKEIYYETKDDNLEVKNIKAYHEDDKWYLSVTFNIQRKDGLYELNIPKIEIPSTFSELKVLIGEEDYYDCVSKEIIEIKDHYIDISNIKKLKIFERNNDPMISLKRVVRKMTINEIEKYLGYKIEIIN